ncbi:MAG: hypothetical protein RLZ12_432 [Bacillota bacterium]
MFFKIALPLVFIGTLATSCGTENNKPNAPLSTEAPPIDSKDLKVEVAPEAKVNKPTEVKVTVTGDKKDKVSKVEVHCSDCPAKVATLNAGKSEYKAKVNFKKDGSQELTVKALDKEGKVLSEEKVTVTVSK